MTSLADEKNMNMQAKSVERDRGKSVGQNGGRLVLLKGEAAAAAEPVTMISRSVAVVESTGPWIADLDEVREEAKRSGFAQGLGEGRQAGRVAAEEQANVRASNAISALDELMVAMEQREEQLGTEFSDHVAELAVTVAQAILSRELSVSSDPGKEAIARCLIDAPKGGEVIANLNPKDIESLGHLESVLEGRSVTIVPDLTLLPGDAMVQIGETRIDGRLSEAMDRVREVLR